VFVGEGVGVGVWWWMEVCLGSPVCVLLFMLPCVCF
jgi:hypothetical protein